MKTVHLFQFNGSPRVPKPLRQTQLEVLELCNSGLRSYYRHVADQVLDFARQGGFQTVVELGAGTAPITRILCEDERADDLRFVVCDLVPNPAQYRRLEEQYAPRVMALLDPVDFTKPREWGPSTLLVLSAAMHHVRAEQRREVIETMSKSADGVMIFAPVRKNGLSLLFSGLTLLPAVGLPLLYIRRVGRLRRFLFCWLIPVVPLMVLWDAVGGCLRQWTDAEWRDALTESVEPGRPPSIEQRTGWQMVAW